jgi:aquaporin Z
MTSNLFRRSLAEGIGTFFLVLIGPGAVIVDAYTGGAIGHAGVALAFGFVVLAMVYALGPISGAHINPAVTIALWSAGKADAREAISYVVGLAAMMAGPLTGASMNPARSLGPALAGGLWQGHWIYWTAPISAMLTAVPLNRFLRDAPIRERRAFPDREPGHP